jgi:hypothetical protein
LAAIATLSNACTPAAYEESARTSDLRTLSTAVERQQTSGGFSRSQLRKLAYAIAERELLAASDPRGNREAEDLAVEQLAPCTLSLQSLLERRSRRGDDTAFAARLTLVEAGIPLRDEPWLELTASAFGWARAAAARASSEPTRFQYRTQALTDPDSRVRRAALRSCLEAPASEHWDALVVLLRGDPDPESRGLAARAVGILGGDDAYRILVDVWPRANETLRLAIVNAFAQRATYDAGGKQRLIELARSEPGLVGVAAATSLALGDPGARNIGNTRITRTLTSGNVEEQRLALVAADWSRAEQAEQLVRLGSQDSDPVVKVAALGRWLEHRNYEQRATTLLRELSESLTPQALLARDILAQHKDRSVVKLLIEQQRYGVAETRKLAAMALYHLGDWTHLARSLADDSPAVRLSTACLVLSPQRDD